jgi:Family of unknown function (DUF5686)/CarboxypepD_reg-like domain
MPTTKGCFLLALSMMLLNIVGQGQQPISGTVTDPDGVPLAFVTVQINDDPGKGVLTDIEGRFKIGADIRVSALTFRYVGFETQRMGASAWSKDPKAIRVVLRPADFGLAEVTIRAGENPADILMRKAIANRRRNDPEKRGAYRCNTYNKVSFDVLPHREVFEKTLSKRDSTKKGYRKPFENFNKIEKNAAERHLFLMESVTERSFLFPDIVQERVLLNRVSGFQNTGFVALANAVQPFGFYGDFLHIADKNFVNPVSPGSPGLYFFNIEDTLYRASDTVWIISFKPRKGKIFEALEGVLHLSSRHWAVQNVRARPADKNSNLTLKIEQAYQFVKNGGPDGCWFPEQLNFEMELENYPSPALGLRASGRSYVSEIQIDPQLHLKDFDPETPLLLESKANTRSDSLWAPWRAETPLNAKELRSYELLDSIGDVKKTDRLARLTEYLATGRAALPGGLALDLGRLLRINDFEGVRLGLGLSNAQTRPLLQARKLEAGAYAGYGFKDKSWKYGAYGLWRIARGYQTQLRLRWQRDLEEPGALNELNPASFFNRTLYARRMDYTDEGSAAFFSRLGKDFQMQLSIRDQRLRPAYPYAFGAPGDAAVGSFRFREAVGFLRFARGEQTRPLFGGNLAAIQRWPVVELAYTRGFGDYRYDRYALALYQSAFVRRLGRVDWRIEAGKVSPRTPYAKLFSLNQTGGSFNLFAVRNTFQALPDTLFLADRFVNVFFAQEIGSVLYRLKWSSPFLTLLQNVSWGDLEHPELHTGIGFYTARRPLLESGVRLDDLLRINYVNFTYFGVGIGCFYRWGSLQSENWRKNVSLRLAMRLKL